MPSEFTLIENPEDTSLLATPETRTDLVARETTTILALPGDAGFISVAPNEFTGLGAERAGMLSCREDMTAIFTSSTAPTAVGPQGPQGHQGDTGDQGPQGVKGDTGAQGDTGLQGPQGTKGIKGDTGFQGAKGDQGDQGDTGSQGDTGPQGFQGNRGFQGADGAQGLAGAKGDQGDQGPQGYQGKMGATGLKGDQGDQGEKGDIGSQGSQGLTGATGPKGDKGFQGFQGDQGADGIDGAQGAQGDTGAQGSTGAQGPTGSQGDTGPQGDQGPQGLRGLTGFTGAQGADGADGADGEQGPQGLRGYQGPQGHQGDIGLQGPQGLTGGTGPQGPQGTQGDQGVGGKGLETTEAYAGHDAETVEVGWQAEIDAGIVDPETGDSWIYMWPPCPGNIQVANSYYMAVRIVTSTYTKPYAHLDPADSGAGMASASFYRYVEDPLEDTEQVLDTVPSGYGPGEYHFQIATYNDTNIYYDSASGASISFNEDTWYDLYADVVQGNNGEWRFYARHTKQAIGYNVHLWDIIIQKLDANGNRIPSSTQVIRWRQVSEVVFPDIASDPFNIYYNTPPYPPASIYELELDFKPDTAVAWYRDTSFSYCYLNFFYYRPTFDGVYVPEPASMYYPDDGGANSATYVLDDYWLSISDGYFDSAYHGSQKFVIKFDFISGATPEGSGFSEALADGVWNGVSPNSYLYVSKQDSVDGIVEAVVDIHIAENDPGTGTYVPPAGRKVFSKRVRLIAENDSTSVAPAPDLTPPASPYFPVAAQPARAPYLVTKTCTDGVYSVVELGGGGGIPDMSTQTFLGRDTAGTGPAEEIDMATARTMLNVAEKTDWPMIRNAVDVGESHTIPDRFQMIVANEMTVDGTLNIDPGGQLIVLEDVDPQTTHPISPDFTYTNGVLTRVDYAGGEYKLFSYDGSGRLEVLDYISNGITKRKQFFYGVGGELDYITQSYI